jgi:16S rRNA processing protein RimM
MTLSRRSETPPPEGLIVGELVGIHGLLGEVKLYPITDDPERLARYRRLVLQFPDGTWQEVRVQRARAHKNIWLLKLRDVNTMEAAEALRGAQVLIRTEQAEPLPEGQFYLHEVIGLRVVTPEGEELGKVTDVLRNPANDIYVAGPYMIPAVKALIERIDPAAGVLVVRSRDSLLMEEVPPDGEGDSPRRHGGHGGNTEGSKKSRIGRRKRAAPGQAGPGDAAQGSVDGK